MLAQGSRCAHACMGPFSVIERYVWIASVCNTTLFPPMEAIVMLNGWLAAHHYAHAHAHACTSDCAIKLLKQKLSCTKHGFLQNLIGFSNHRCAVGCVNNLAWNQCSPPYWTRGSFRDPYWIKCIEPWVTLAQRWWMNDQQDTLEVDW